MFKKLVLFADQPHPHTNDASAELDFSNVSLSPFPEPHSAPAKAHVNRSTTIETVIKDSPSSHKRPISSSSDVKAIVERPHFRSSDYKLASNIFTGLLMSQYILIFFAIPFSEVDNRPAASVLLCLLGYLLFLLCILMIPAGLINVPTNLSFQSLVISCILKVVDLGANIYSVILCLRVKEPMIEYTFDQDSLPVRPLDITVYIQVISCLLLAMSVISLCFAVVVFLFNFTYFQATKRSEVHNTLGNNFIDSITV